MRQIISPLDGFRSPFGRLMGGTAPFTPAVLFGASEPGVWYDPSDLTTLFQDTAGTTPVTTPGQTVALALDKSKGLVLGSELVTNGTFDGGSTGWTVGTNWSIGSGAASKAAGASGNLTQAAGIVSGRFYKVSFDLTISGGNLWVNLGANDTFSNVQTTSGRKEFFTTATGANGNLQFQGATNVVVTIDNISVRELPGFHATQATLASRPTYGIVPLGGRRNLYTQTADLTNLTNWPSIDTANASRSGAGLSVTTSEGYAYIARPTNADSFTSGVTYTLSLTVVCNQTIANVPLRVVSGGPGTAGATALVSMVAGVPQRVFFTFTATTTGASTSRFGIDARDGVVPGGSNATGYVVTFSDPQLETGSTATAYQRVGSAFDVTEAGVASLSYLSFDGVDDFMVTPTITPGIDKAQVFAGVRPLSTTANQTIYATDPLNSVAGSFGLRVNTATALQPLLYGSSLSSSTPTIPSIPVSLVTTQLADIGAITGLENGLRVNGGSTVFAVNAAGTGNLSAQPLYIGRYLGTSNPFNGQIYSLIVRFGTNLDAGTITSTETWVNSKTGAYT